MDDYMAPKTHQDFLWAVAHAADVRDPDALDFLEGVVQGWIQDPYLTMAQEQLLESVRDLIYDSDLEMGKAEFDFPS